MKRKKIYIIIYKKNLCIQRRIEFMQQDRTENELKKQQQQLKHTNKQTANKALALKISNPKRNDSFQVNKTNVKSNGQEIGMQEYDSEWEFRFVTRNWRDNDFLASF